MRALVADDDESVRRLARRALEAVGCEVSACASGAELVGAARLRAPDLIVSDVQMPGAIDGAEACRRAAGAAAVILMTGNPERADALRKEGWRVLDKPFAVAELQSLALSAGNGARR